MNRKKILATTDLTPSCDVAINKAIESSIKYDKWLEIIHVIDPPMFEICVGSECQVRHEREEEVREKKEHEISAKIKEGLRRTTDKLHIKTRIGNPAEEIVEYAKEIEASAIIMGETDEKEYGTLEKLFLGTTVKRVVSNADIPVLVVKNKEEREYSKIMIPIDFTEESKEAVRYTAGLFPDAELYLLNILEIPSDFRLKFYGLNDEEISEIAKAERTKMKNRMFSYINELKIDNKIHEVVVEGALIPERVIDEAIKAGVDMVSVYAHNINEVSTKMVGSISAEILDMSKIDVLVYQEKQN